MRNVPPETAVSEALDAILADLRESLAGLRRPDALVAAEETLLAARAARATAADVYRDAIRGRGNVERDRLLKELEAAVLAAKAGVDRADAVVARAQTDVDRRRAEHGQTIVATVAKYRAAAAVAVNRASEILAVTAELAAREHCALPDALAFIPASSGLISELYRSIAQEKNRGERAFSAVARAIGKPNFKPPEIPKTWRGKVGDFMGGGAVEGDSPVRPGSNHKTQRIPRSALDRVR
jgi:hypothetical protein